MRFAMKRASVLALLLVSTACVSTNATVLDLTPQSRPPVAATQVRIYRSAAQVAGKYTEVALLNASGESSWTDEQKMLESMRKKAGALGANGVILDAISEASAGAKIAGAVFGTGSQRKGRAVAIFVVADSAKAP
jgi:uncharacterized protein YbjQ (UPF0145 family)